MVEMSEAAREAQRAYNREWEAKNRERRNEYRRRWAAEHREKVAARRKGKNAQYNASRWERKAARMQAAQQELEDATP